MKKRIRTLFICFLLSTFLIGFLFKISDNLNHKKNGFIRLMPPHAVLVQNDITFNAKDYYIAGLTDYNIYFGSYRNPNQLLIFNYTLNGSQILTLTPPETKLVWWTVKIEVDSPDIFLMDGISRIILHKQLESSDSIERISIPVNFDESISLLSRNFILRTYNIKAHGNVLSKVKLNGERFDNVSILEQQADGVFSTDGILMPSRNRNTLVYVYFYRNQFICMDSNLNLRYRARTIDTNTLAKLKVRSYESGKTQTIASPPLMINPRICINEDRIFIHSALLANNEEKKLFNQASVIDVYSLKEGHYKNSFYLPEHNGNKISDFAIIGNKVIALYPDGIISAVLNLNYPK